MKVTRVNVTKFEPITLIIDTQEDADVLWQLLNMSEFNFANLTEESAYECAGDSDVFFNMFQAFDKFHRPAKH